MKKFYSILVWLIVMSVVTVLAAFALAGIGLLLGDSFGLHPINWLSAR